MSQSAVDLSFLNPQALAPNSLILRLPLLSSLRSRAASWNALWVETFELVTNERPESCRVLLDKALPSWPGMPNPLWISGYVWHGGFTIFRITPWRNNFRAIGTGTFGTEHGLTHVSFRVGLNRFGVYALAVLGLFFVAFAGLTMAVGVTTGQPVWAVIGIVVLVIPPMLFLAGGRRVAPARQRSEEAIALLAILESVIGTREVHAA